MNKTLLQAHLRYRLQRHGWLAAAGLLVSVLALLLHMFWVEGLYQRNAELQDSLRDQQRTRLQKQPAGEDKAQAQAALFASLPDATQAVDAVAVLNRAAVRNKVALSTAEYRITQSAAGPLLRYQISVPLRSDYVHLRAWLAEVLNTLPSAALDDLNLRRDDVGQELLDARVRFTVFLRAP
jgi:heme exporter protein D